MKNIIRERVLLARDGFMSQTVDPVDTGMRTAFDCVLLPQPKIRHTQWDHGDTTSRALLAWQYVREITGDTQIGREIEEGLWRHDLSLLHPETGLAFVPEHSDAANGQYYYHLWDQGRVLTTLATRLRTSWGDVVERERLLVLIRRMQAGMTHLASRTVLPDGEVALTWGSDAFWNDSTVLPTDRDFGDQNWVGWCLVASQLIEPQAMLAAVTGDEQDFDLALMAARGFLAGFEERRHSTAPMFAADGHFRGHFHSAVSGLLGLVKLSRLLWDRNETGQAKEWIDLIVNAYRWIFDAKNNVNPGCSCGYFPETASETPHACSELCCVADMVELAAELAQCASLDPRWAGLSDLWDDVERFTRNEIFKMQFTSLDRLLPHTADPATARDILSRLLGTWGSCRSFLPDAGMYPGRAGVQLNMPQAAAPATDDTPMLTTGGCCAYSGVRALYTAWKEAVTTEERVTTVRISSRHEDPNVVLRPLAEGGIQFHARRDHTLRIRIPSRVRADDVRVEGSQVQEWSSDHRWLSLMLRADDKGIIQWPVVEWSTREVAGPLNHLGLWPDTPHNERLSCILDYRGNELICIRPAGKKLPYIRGL